MNLESPIPKKTPSQKFLLGLAAAALLAAVFLFSFFGITRSLRHDECCSVEIASANWPGIIENLNVNAHTPPLYYFLLNLWMKLFGTGEASVRGISALFYMLSLPAIFALGKSLFDRRAALLSAFLFMVSPVAIWHAQDARMYSLLAFLGILSTFFFFRLFVLKTAPRPELLFYILTNVAGTFTQYWFFFILFAQGSAWFLLFRKNYPARFLAAAGVSVLPFFVLWTPVVLKQLANGGTSWMTRPGPGVLLSSFLIFYGGKFSGLLVYAALTALVIFGFQGWKLHRQSLLQVKQYLLERTNLTLALLALLSLLVPLLVSQITPIYVEDRYTIVALAPTALLWGGLLGRFGNKTLVSLFALALLAAVTFNFVNRRTNPAPLSFRSLVGWVAQNGKNGDLLLLSTSSRSGMDYYLGRMESRPNFIKFSFPAEMAHHPCWLNVARATKDTAWLREEARSLSAGVDSLLADGGRLWLVRGHYTEVDNFIETALNARFQEVQSGIPAALAPSLIQYKKRPSF